MEKINFKDAPSTETPLSAFTLNKMQEGIEESVVIISPTEPTTNERVWLKKGKNLFDKSKAIKNMSIDENGVFEYDQTASVHYVQVIPGETYSISSNLNRQWVLNTSVNEPSLNESGSARTVAGGTTIQVTVPDGHNYLNIRNHPSSSNEDSVNQDVQVEQGSTATAYEEYIEPAIYVKNNNDVFEEFIKKQKGLVKLSGQVNFDSEASLDTELQIVLSGNVKDYDVLLIQASPDFEGGTGILFTNAPNGSNVVIRIGLDRPDGAWHGVIRAWLYNTDTTILRVKIIEKGSDRPISNFGVQAVYGVKF